VRTCGRAGSPSVCVRMCYVWACEWEGGGVGVVQVFASVC
jgi:hypothetical protein